MTTEKEKTQVEKDLDTIANYVSLGCLVWFAAIVIGCSLGILSVFVQIVYHIINQQS